MNMMYLVEHDVPLPLGVNLQCLNDGSGIANTLLTNNASYHNGCRGRFRNRTKDGSYSDGYGPHEPMEMWE